MELGFLVEKSDVVADLVLVSPLHENLADRTLVGVALPRDYAYGFGFRQNCGVDHTEGVEVPEALLAKYYPDQEESWGEEEEVFAAVGLH